MTRFEQELSGALGVFWKKHAEEEIAKMQRRVDNDEIRTNANGGAFWNSNGNYLPADCAEARIQTGTTIGEITCDLEDSAADAPLSIQARTVSGDIEIRKD